MLRSDERGIKMNVVPASEIDIDELCDMWKELQDYHKGMNLYTPESEEWRTYKKKEIQLLLQSENSKIFLVKGSNEILGYVRGVVQNVSPVFKVGKIGRIEEMFVKKEFRRQGIGNLLIHSIKQWFKEKMVERIDIQVGNENISGKLFWENEEFKTNSIKMTYNL